MTSSPALEDILKTSPLKGKIICLSGFNKSEETSLKNKIENLGGTFSGDLLAETTLLITKKINTKKSIVAGENGIRMVTKEYLDTNNPRCFLNDDNCVPPCFLGATLFLYGFDEDTKKEMTGKISKLGGFVVEEDINEAELILIQNNIEFTENELRSLNSNNLTIVNNIWYDECISFNKYMNTTKDKYKLHTTEISTKYEKLYEDIINGQLKNDLLFFGLSFFIHGLPPKETQKLTNLIGFRGGLVTSRLIENLNYIIVPITVSDPHSFNSLRDKFGRTPNVVNFKWVFDSIKNEKIMEDELYKPIKSLCIESLSSNPFNKIESGVTYINNKKIYIISSILENQTFSIVSKSYKPKEREKLIQMIEENGGKVMLNEEDKFKLKDFLGKFVVLQDGYYNIWNSFIEEKEKEKLTKIIISHRYILECINEKRLVDIKDYFHLLPLGFKVPLEFFKNIVFSLKPDDFYLPEKDMYEKVIELLGGRAEDLFKGTNYIIVRKPYSKEILEKIKNRYNSNIKCIQEEYLFYVLSCGNPEKITDYIVE